MQRQRLQARPNTSGRASACPESADPAYRSAPGVPATVTVTVSCTVSFADLRAPGLPGVPAGKAVTARFTSPLDTYRSRALGFGNTEARAAGSWSGGGL